jgi:hypothetical protein
MRKILLASFTRFFVFVVFLGAMLGAPPSASAQFYVDTAIINVGAPQVPAGLGIGVLAIELYDAASDSTCLVDVYVKSGMTAAVKAQRMVEALHKEIKHCGCPFAVVWIKPTTVKIINKNPNRTTWAVHMKPPDTTEEGDVMTILPPRKGTWQWAFTLWIYPNTMTPPAGTELWLTAQEPSGTTYSVAITADGMTDSAQLQTMAIAQLEAQGIVFTKVLNAMTGTHGYQSQWFPGTSSSGTGWVQWTSGWASYIGTYGVLASPQ